MAGQRVPDIFAVAAAVRGRDRTVLADLRDMAVSVTLAAAFDPAINLIYAAKGLESWASLLQQTD